VSVHRPGTSGAAPALGPTLALTVVAAVAAFSAVAPLLHMVLPATELPTPFPPQHQRAESLSFVVAFAVILPLALLLVPRALTAVAASRQQVTSGLAAALSGVLLALIALARLVDRLTSIDGALVVLAAAACWWAVAYFAFRTAAAGGGTSLGERSLELWIADSVLLLTAVLAFVDLGELNAWVALAGALTVAVGILLYSTWSPPTLRRAGIRHAIDASVVVLLLLAVPNLLVFDLGDAFQTRIIDFHQNFFLGPANQVLGGGGVLIDTLSQYGVGSIYFLTAWFELAPIGNGTLGFIEGVLSAFVFAAAYLTIRLAGSSWPVAAGAMATAVIALVYGLEYPLGALLQHGAIRFGLPMIPLLAATYELVRPAHARGAQVVQVLALGVASIWALEALAYTALTVAAMLAVRVWLAPAAERRRTSLRWIGVLPAACIVFHVVLALATLIGYGELPRWGLYINTLREFLSGSLGDLTYDVAPWSPAFVVGAIYMASAAGVVLLIRWRPGLVRERAATVMALAGATAYGVALLSYFVNRSAGHILPYVCLPAIIVVAIWLGLLLSRRDEASLPIRVAALGACSLASVLLIASAWQGAGQRLSESALAYALPGGPSLSQGLDRLWHPPDLRPGATDGAETLARCMPDEDSSYVLTDADLGIEILDKAGRSNRFPLGDPWEDSFVPDHHIPGLAAAVDDLQPGDRILVDPTAYGVYRDYLREPERDPLSEPFGEDALVPTGIAKLQEWLLKEIGARYELRHVCGPFGAKRPFVVEVVP
jgi:hypothetical protein